ncbi:MAG: winged helix DNA-binding protein [Alphaproteobacteria bacterium]|nr:winged helix DNA-binding protein [Alphaproteobacteria bacterium]
MARKAATKKSASFKLDTAPGHLLRRAQQFAYDLYMEEVGRSGLTPRQFTVLHAVQQDEGLSQTDLVRKTGIDRSTLADMISRLLKKGLLQRERTKTDQRANAVSITAAGKRALDGAMPKVSKAEDRILQSVDSKLRSDFVAALTQIAAKMDAAEMPKPTARKARATKAKAKPARKAKAAPKAKAAKKGGRKAKR